MNNIFIKLPIQQYKEKGKKFVTTLHRTLQKNKHMLLINDFTNRTLVSPIDFLTISMQHTKQLSLTGPLTFDYIVCPY